MAKSGKALHKIRELEPGLKGVNTEFIILEKGPSKQARNGGKFCQLLVADQTASIFMTLWDEYISQFEVSDIVLLKNGYSGLHKNSLLLNVGKNGSLQRLGEFSLLFTETPNMSHANLSADKSRAV